jgi:hypothetical protein
MRHDGYNNNYYYLERGREGVRGRNILRKRESFTLSFGVFTLLVLIWLAVELDAPLSCSENKKYNCQTVKKRTQCGDDGGL